MKKSLSLLLTTMVSLFLLLTAVSCSADSGITESNSSSTATGKISGKVTFSNVDESANGGIMVTLDKTDGLRTLAVSHSVSSRSLEDSARTVVDNSITAKDGSYSFSNLEPGTYTVYAASTYSSERAVCTNVVVRSAETTIADTLKLTATGSIRGTITIDENESGNTGFLVFVAGTSYMAMTDDAGNYTISGVPAGSGYQLVATKNGVIFNLDSYVLVNANEATFMSSFSFSSNELDSALKGEKGDSGADGKDGTSLVWLGAYSSDDEIENPQYLNAYFNTTDGCSYIYNGYNWELLARSGANGADGKDGNDGTNGVNGVSIVWKGELDTAPTEPGLNWAYYNTKTGCSYIWNGTKWNLLSKAGVDGQNGDTGAEGTSIVWKGELLSAPSNPEKYWAYYNTIDGSSYIYDGKDWSLLVKGSDNSSKGAIIDGTTLTGWENPKGNITIPNGVTNIASWTFKDCTALTSVIIPDSVTSIGSFAFINCTALTSVIIPDSVTTIEAGAFCECTELTSITIPDSVTSIGGSAFSNCTALTSVTIPKSVTTIEDCAFNGCSGITTVNYKGTLEQWLCISFDGSGSNPCAFGADLYINGTKLTNITIPNSITTIGANVFYGCRGLTNITIPDNVTSIGKSAFANCSGLTSVLIPNSVTTIGEWAFYNCTGLTGITLSDKLISIDDFMFYNCSGLVSIIISDSITSIGKSAFQGCCSLIRITIPNTVTNIDAQAFAGCSGLTNVTIPNRITTIGNGVFGGCSGLTTITIPKGVSSIGNYAFSGCIGLINITIPDSVQSIGKYAFLDCNKLTHVYYEGDFKQWFEISFAFNSNTGQFNSEEDYSSNPFIHATHFYIDGAEITDLKIPKGVTSIGKYAFYNCRSLTSITIPESVTNIEAAAFTWCTGLTKVNYEGNIEKWLQISFGASANPLYYAHHLYIGGSEVTDLIIPDGVTSIGQFAFYGCSGLTSVIIPDSVKNIGGWAFSDCSGITSITLSDNVTSIGPEAFFNCSGLTRLNYEGSIEKWLQISFDSVNQNPLYYAHHLYIGGSEVTDLIIPDNVTTIGQISFWGCSGLTSITIPKAVTKIGDYAFVDCSGLATVNYTGSKAQWQAISMGNNNEALTNATIIYNYTENTDTIPKGFVLVTGGTHDGSTELNPPSNIFTEETAVTIRDLYVCDHEVTQAEYETYCKYGLDGEVIFEPNEREGKGDNFPAYYVSWHDAIVYCNLRSMAENLTPVYSINGITNPANWSGIVSVNGKYSGPSTAIYAWETITFNTSANGYRLPTEAEWEYIARGGIGGISQNHYLYSGSDSADDVAWCQENSNGKAHEVRAKLPNTLGIYDMSGNVWEWCWDIADTTSVTAYDGYFHVIRGGSCDTYSDVDMGFHYWLSVQSPYAQRGFRRANISWLGFRVVRNAK